MLTILQGDWIERLRELPEASVQCCVTSPPYDDLRTYGQGDNLSDWDFPDGSAELSRVMEPGGTICWVVGSQVINGSESLSPFVQAAGFVEECGLRLHDTMIWEKTHVATPCATRYHQMFEYIFVFTKGKQKTFNPIEDRKNLWAGAEPFSYNSKRQQDGSIVKTRDADARGAIREYGRRSNIWKGNSAAQENPCTTLPHPAMMPKWLVRDLILSFSNPGDTVLDPFGGSGTTGMVALELGRKATLIELNPDYVKLIEQRCRVTPGLQLA